VVVTGGLRNARTICVDLVNQELIILEDERENVEVINRTEAFSSARAASYQISDLMGLRRSIKSPCNILSQSLHSPTARASQRRQQGSFSGLQREVSDASRACLRCRNKQRSGIDSKSDFATACPDSLFFRRRGENFATKHGLATTQKWALQI